MNKRACSSSKLRRRGVTLVLSAILIVTMLGMVAFAIDMGYIMLVRTQLQVAADSAAMAAAAHLGRPLEEIVAAADEYAGYHVAGGKLVEIGPADVELGLWDTDTRRFTPSAEMGNAVRVTARRGASTGGETPLFFARLFGQSSFRMSASAVAMANPRDIAFVVDLSGSMNDDAEPCWATDEINRTFAPEGYPTVGSELMQQLFTDFGFGSCPGQMEYLGEPWGVRQDAHAYADLTKDGGPLTDGSVPGKYRIEPSDSEMTRKSKAYSAIIDGQIARMMPAALPTPDSAVNYGYWAKYLDYIVDAADDRGPLPPQQDSDRITGFNNPNRSTFPDADQNAPAAFQNRIGYLTYVQFMADHGRDLKPDGTTYVPLSRHSPVCPWHSESTAGGTFSFPPREQPTHAARRALIAAMNVVRERNSGIGNPDQADWVSVIGFDTLSGGGPVILQPLTADYDAAMQACTQLQAVGDKGASTATETGLETARLHIRSRADGGQGRLATNKVVVLLTDGVPNLYTSSTGDIDGYMCDHPSDDYYGRNSYALDAPLMQAAMMEQSKWYVFPVGVGLGTDYDFMDRLARIGGSADDNGRSPRGSGNPAAYEQRLTDIFEKIITNPQVRLVQ